MYVKFSTALLWAVALSASILLLGGCSKSENDGCEWQAELADFDRKTELYSNHTNATNCKDMQQAATRLMNKLGECPGAERVKEMVAPWRTLDCSLLD